MRRTRNGYVKNNYYYYYYYTVVKNFYELARCSNINEFHKFLIAWQVNKFFFFTPHPPSPYQPSVINSPVFFYFKIGTPIYF
jgi:hypothetical protein